SIGKLTWPLIRDVLAGVVSVTDDEIRAAVRWLDLAGLRVEPSGSVTTAAVLARKHVVTGPTVVVCSGGNVDAARYQELIAG
ncbi:MAG: pyridoxal-phosphate dependent enzyme, partial [Gemmatimonadota bacterium]